MLLCYGDDHASAEAEREQLHEKPVQLAHEIESNGQHPTAPVPGVRMMRLVFVFRIVNRMRRVSGTRPLVNANRAGAAHRLVTHQHHPDAEIHETARCVVLLRRTGPAGAPPP